MVPPGTRTIGLRSAAARRGGHLPGEVLDGTDGPVGPQLPGREYGSLTACEAVSAGEKRKPDGKPQRRASDVD